MKTSEAVSEISKAFAAMQSELKPASKDAVNPAFKSKYADLAAIWDACRDPLSRNGLFVGQDVTSEPKRVSVTTRVMHVSGQWFEFGPFSVPVEKETAHGLGSATSYAKRYALSAALGVVAENDDDGNEASSRSSQSVAQRIVTIGGSMLGVPKQEWHPVDGPPLLSDADMPLMDVDYSPPPDSTIKAARRFSPDGSAFDSLVVPFGRDKGKTLAEIDMRSLEWLASAAKSNINDPAKSKWRSKEQAWLAQVESEIARRQQ